jgi:S-adenosyl-L-methionine hydrolase (adenosine-forming)
MRIVTLTTDMGNSDYYSGALKGALLSSCTGIMPIEIATQVNNYDIKQGAYIIRHAYPYYPTGTIHLLNINAPESNGDLIVTAYDGHYFITFNNGSLPLIFGLVPEESYLVKALDSHQSLFYIAGISTIINTILSSQPLSSLGTPAHQIRQLRWMMASTSDGNIRGNVLQIDKYGNAITNITRAMYERYIAGGRYVILFAGTEIIELCTHYGDVPQGDVACFFNAAGHLEIAINKGNASKLFALKPDSPILFQRI